MNCLSETLDILHNNLRTAIKIRDGIIILSSVFKIRVKFCVKKNNCMFQHFVASVYHFHVRRSEKM